MEVAYFKCVLNNLQHELLPLHFKENESSAPVCPQVRFRLNNLNQLVQVLSSLSDYEISRGQRLNPDWMAILKAYKRLIKCDEKDSLFRYIDILEDLSFNFQIFRNRMKLRSRVQYTPDDEDCLSEFLDRSLKTGRYPKSWKTKFRKQKK